jgi:hypothetical protein
LIEIVVVLQKLCDFVNLIIVFAIVLVLIIPILSRLVTIIFKVFVCVVKNVLILPS